MKFYKVADIHLITENIVDNEGAWNYFRSTLPNEGQIFFCVVSMLNGKCWGYQNLEAFQINMEVCHILRRERDVMFCNADYTLSQILPVIDSHNITGFLVQLFYTHAIRRQMLQLHCSIVDDHGRGILFLGPSGIGKTTQAEKWAEYRGSSIINGDVGFVQRTPEGQIAWGTPWHGSSPYCLNASVPVKALVVLKQAPFNALRELSGFEKVSEVSGSVFYPTWLPDGIETAAGLFDRLLTDLPVYRLDNRADREGVELLARELDRIS